MEVDASNSVMGALFAQQKESKSIKLVLQEKGTGWKEQGMPLSYGQITKPCISLDCKVLQCSSGQVDIIHLCHI